MSGWSYWHARCRERKLAPLNYAEEFQGICLVNGYMDAVKRFESYLAAHDPPQKEPWKWPVELDKECAKRLDNIDAAFRSCIDLWESLKWARAHPRDPPRLMVNGQWFNTTPSASASAT